MNAIANTNSIEKTEWTPGMSIIIPGVPVLDAGFVRKHMDAELATAPAPTVLGKLWYATGVSFKTAHKWTKNLPFIIHFAIVLGLLVAMSNHWVTPALAFGSIAIMALFVAVGPLVRLRYPAKWRQVPWEEFIRRHEFAGVLQSEAIPQTIIDRVKHIRAWNGHVEVLLLEQGDQILDPVLVGQSCGIEFYSGIWKDNTLIA